MKSCKGCKWAEWQRTSNGRLHPSGQGRCVFPVKPIILPASVIHTYSGDEGLRILQRVINGHRIIDRQRELRDHCQCYAPEAA